MANLIPIGDNCYISTGPLPLQCSSDFFPLHEVYEAKSPEWSARWARFLAEFDVGLAGYTLNIFMNQLGKKQ